MTILIWNVYVVLTVIIQMLAIPKNSTHECSWRVYKSKWHDSKSEQTSVTHKGGEISVFLMHRNLPVSLAEV